MGRAAWNAYWALLAVLVLVLVAYVAARAAVAPAVWGVGFAVPLVLAGIDLVVFARSHEEICRLEGARHRWLGTMTGGGYSARMFLVTGILCAVGGIVLGGWIALR